MCIILRTRPRIHNHPPFKGFVPGYLLGTVKGVFTNKSQTRRQEAYSFKPQQPLELAPEPLELIHGKPRMNSGGGLPKRARYLRVILKSCLYCQSTTSKEPVDILLLAREHGGFSMSAGCGQRSVGAWTVTAGSSTSMRFCGPMPAGFQKAKAFPESLP